MAGRPKILVLVKGLGIGGAERLISEGSRFWDTDSFDYRVAYVLPWTLSIPLDNSVYSSVAIALMTGTEPLTYLPLATTLSASILFMAVALWIFQRLEF